MLLSIQCVFTRLTLWWHSLPLLSGFGLFPHLKVKSVLTHKPLGSDWTVTEFLLPRWGPATKLRINSRGAMARQKNQCLFIQTWQYRRPSNSTTGFWRHSPPPVSYFSFFRLFFLVCQAPSSAGNKCVSSGEDEALGDAGLAIVPWIYPIHLWRHYMRSAECFGQTVSSELSRKKCRN